MLNFLDKVANAGARSTMPAEKLATAKGRSESANQCIQLAQVAVNSGAARTARKAAEAQLVREVGASEAKKLMKQTTRKIRNSFSG